MKRADPTSQRLRSVGLRPTAQRIALAELLFDGGNRHVTAEELHAEATARGIRLSVATVYNTLHQFTTAGLLRVLAIDGTRTWFDTNVMDHHHFFIEKEGTMVDIDACEVQVANLPAPPADTEIERVDIIIRLRLTYDRISEIARPDHHDGDGTDVTSV